MADSAAFSKFTSPDPGSKCHEDIGFIAMPRGILEAGVSPQFLAVPSPCLPVLGCRQYFQLAIGHCLPRSVNLMHHSSSAGGDTLVQDPTCSGDRAEKATTKRSS
eukprot:2024379-Ditylum_brightwellii.AAC.1